MAGSGANRRGPGHHERSGPNQDHDDVLRAGPDLFRPQSRLPDRGRLHCSPRRADPARLLHLALRVLGLDHRQPGHGESVLPQHVGPRRGTSVYAALGIILSSNGKPADHTSIENPTGTTRAVCSVTPRPGWNTICAATRLRPPPSPGRIRSWSRTLTGQAAPPSEPGPAAKVPGLANTGNPANGEVARSRHRTPGSGKPRIAPADSTIPRRSADLARRILDLSLPSVT